MAKVLAAQGLPRLIVRPLQDFLRTESAGGVLLLIATAAALIWVNAPFGGTYGDFWGAHVRIDLNVVDLDESLVQWVNDGLMTIFFFVVGLEIKRELLEGELADRRKAALPVAAAVGGMIVPAAIYLAFNAGRGGEHGWGIPMATDIAFAVGVVTLLGSRVPTSLKVFLLALAIADDIGAIIVIAIFYSGDISAGWLAAAGALLTLVVALGRAGIRGVVIYLAVGLVTWLAVFESGVHATIAGVALGLLTPTGPAVQPDEFIGATDDLLRQFRIARMQTDADGQELSQAALSDLENLARQSQPVLDRLEHALHPWTGYLVVPIFALANAGVELDAGSLRHAAGSPVSLGVALGLIAGKPLGIILAAWLACKAGIAALPDDARWRQLAGVGVVAGIGFTVSLFIGNLAFSQPELIADAKIGVLAGSALMGIVGIVALHTIRPAR